MPGGNIMRHSVRGAGELTWLILPLVLAGIVAVFRTRDASSRVIGVAALAMLILYPIPDAISADKNAPPYTFSAFSLMICSGLLAALGISWICGLIGEVSPRRRIVRHASALAILALVLVTGYRFWDGPYHNYPNVSADYWGWQYGAGESLRRIQVAPWIRSLHS